MPKCTVLVGAPEADQWRSADLTIDTFLPAFAAFCDIVHDAQLLDTSILSQRSTVPSPQRLGCAWRSVPVTARHLPTGLSQRQWMRPGLADYQYEECYGQHGAKDDKKHRHRTAEISFFTATSMEAGNAEELEDELSQFLEQSFALHDEVPLSQMTTEEGDDTFISLAPSSFSATTPLSIPQSFHETSRISPPSSPSGLPSTYNSSLLLPSISHLTSLNHLPSAAHLNRINPQTMTVDLICGIISISATRSVTVRRTGKSIDLVELLLGDETRAGFSVTCWVTSSENSGLAPTINSREKQYEWEERDCLRSCLNRLRRGDVVLLRNVALAQFRNVVHGQSLGRRSRRGAGTVVRLLYRKGRTTDIARHCGYDISVDRYGGNAAAYDMDALNPDGEEAGAERHILQKVSRVKDWVMRFVGPVDYELPGKREGNGRAKKRKRISLDELPSDTRSLFISTLQATASFLVKTVCVIISSPAHQQRRQS